MANALISIALQLGLILAIAFGVYYARRRPEGGFFAFVGLTPAPARALALGAAFGLAAALLLLLVPGMREMGRGHGTVTGDAVAAGIDAEAVAALVLTAVIKTSLSEELLFRGLIGRNLIRRLDFQSGNAIQAVLFGAVHLLLLLTPAGRPAFVLLLVAVAGLSGWVSGWLNERFANGSILPGWALHGTTNVVAYLSLVGVFG